jgi:hypothetical protein
MSFSFKVRAGADGNPELAEFSGTLPAGDVVVSGHADRMQRNVSAAIRYPDGTVALSAGATSGAALCRHGGSSS